MGHPKNRDAVCQEQTVLQPKAYEIYYNVCGSNDQYNRHQQGTLQMEKKMQTKSRDKRVTAFLYKNSTGGKLIKFCAQDCCRMCIKAHPPTVCSLCIKMI